MATTPASLLVGGTTGWHDGSGTITYSFLGTTIPTYYPPLDTDGDNIPDAADVYPGYYNVPYTANVSLSVSERQLATAAINAWNEVANVNLVPGGTSVGDSGGGGGTTMPVTGNGTLVSGLGGAAGFGETTVPTNDDGYQSYDISAVFETGLNFFGSTYSTAFVNTNGSISFNGGISTYTPSTITGGTTPIIAPFWADVDTRADGDPATPDSAPIYVDIDPVADVVTITWNDVGYFDYHADVTNAFQLQLYDRGAGDFDIVFRYQAINWTTGDASGGEGGLGGTPAHAGFSAGNGSDFFELPQSGNQADLLGLDAVNGNTGETGLWVFQVRNGQVFGDVTFGVNDFNDPSLFGFVSAFAGTPGTPSPEGDVWINSGNTDQNAATLGNTGWQTYLHELGHGLGLHHPDEDPNNTAGDPTNNNQYTVMSYVGHPGEAGQSSLDEDWPVTPMMYDIAALQQLYGANMSTRSGNTTYFGPGDGGTTAYALTDGGNLASTGRTAILTIWDAGGTDTIDASNQSGAVTIDLTPGGFSTIGSVINNIGLAMAHVVDGRTVNFIENATGGQGNDNIGGNNAGNHLKGGDGDDSLFGGGGNDILEGQAGADLLNGGTGRDRVSYAGNAVAVTVDLVFGTATGGDAEGDTMISIEEVEGSIIGDDTLSGSSVANGLLGLGGDDVLRGRGGADRLDGGAGIDIATYTDSDAGVMVDLAAGTGSGGDAAGDTLTSIEIVHGSQFGDSLQGRDAADTLRGFGGDDVLRGRGGADLLEGGDGIDTVTYTDSAAAVSIDLAAGSASGGDAAGDRLTSIEIIHGSQFNDTLQGRTAADTLRGFGGDDVLRGRGGADRLEGGDGIDTATYTDSAAAVGIDLALGTGSGGDATGDVLTGIEVVHGSRHGDTLQGAAAGDTLRGFDGDDVLRGRGGADILEGGDGIDTATYTDSAAAVGIDLALGTGSGGDAAGDILTSIETVHGSQFNDTLQGRAAADTLRGFGGDDVLRGRGGADLLEGGDGIDTATYTDSAAAVSIDLATGTGGGGDAAGDRLTGIEIIHGSRYGDTIQGGAAADTLRGFGGDDVLRGRGGADLLEGGDGADTATYTDSAAAVAIDLSTGTGSGGDAAGDTLTSIEIVHGSGFGDSLQGRTTADTLRGFGGDDVLRGRGGADLLEGGDGTDTATYTDSAAAVSIDLAAGAGSGGDAAGDILTSIEIVHGSGFGDSLQGRNTADTLRGFGGDDVLRGRGGADLLEGGDGVDTATYTDSNSRVTVDLNTGIGSAGDAAGDRLTGIEVVHGSGFDDVLYGGNGAETLRGFGGNDVLRGRGGADRLEGGAGDDRFVFAALSDAGTGADRDMIGDFARGDVLDFRDIDARSDLAGDQAFRFLGSRAFDGVAGSMRVDTSGTSAVVQIDADGDRIADMDVVLYAYNDVTTADFMF